MQQLWIPYMHAPCTTNAEGSGKGSWQITLRSARGPRAKDGGASDLKNLDAAW